MNKSVLYLIRKSLMTKKLKLIIATLTLYTINCLLFSGDIFTYYTYFYNYPTNLFIVHGTLFLLLVASFLKRENSNTINEFIRYKSRFSWFMFQLLKYQIVILYYLFITFVISSLGVLLVHNIDIRITMASYLSLFSPSVEYIGTNIILMICFNLLILYLYLSVLTLLILITEKLNLYYIFNMIPAIIVNLYLMSISSLPQNIRDWLYEILFIKLKGNTTGLLLNSASLTKFFAVWISIIAILLVLYFFGYRRHQLIKSNFYIKSSFIGYYIKSKIKILMLVIIGINVSCLISKYMWQENEYLLNVIYVVNPLSIVSYANFIFIPILAFTYLVDLLENIKNKMGIFIFSRLYNLEHSRFILKNTCIFVLILYFSITIITILLQYIFIDKIYIGIEYIIYLVYLLNLMLLVIVLFKNNISKVYMSLTSILYLIIISKYYNSLIIITIFVTLAILYILLENRNRKMRDKICSVK